MKNNGCHPRQLPVPPAFGKNTQSLAPPDRAMCKKSLKVSKFSKVFFKGFLQLRPPLSPCDILRLAVMERAIFRAPAATHTNSLKTKNQAFPTQQP